MKSFRLIFVLVLALGLLLPGQTSLARQTEADGPIYIVQEGDSLWSIALRFRVSMSDLENINQISNPNQLAVGMRLVIPGLEGIQGVLVTRDVAYGETMLSISRRYQIPVEMLVRLNHLTSPAELFAGATLVLLEQNASSSPTRRTMLLPGQSLLEMAMAQGGNPWNYVLSNDLDGTWDGIPGDVFHLPNPEISAQVTEGPSALPEAITAVELKPEPFIQGKAAVIRVSGEDGLSMAGTLNGHPLHFFPDGHGSYVGLQGIYAMTEPGLYTMVITGTLPDQTPYFKAPFAISQAVYILGGEYPFDPPLAVSPETIDPAVTKPEEAQWAALTAPVTAEKLWDGIFQSPAQDPYKDCYPSRFGNRRSYNGSAYIYFHTGLDFCGGVGNQVSAPAAGIVVFAGPLTVRGNATLINHGWGVYSGYLHQSELKVKAGDHVEAGQVIGLVGGTGRVTGPHLHWEIWVGGFQVDPLDWLEQVYP